MDIKEFEEKTKNSQRPVITYFWATWCTPCKFMSPGLEKTRLQFSDTVNFIKVNADEANELVQHLGIFSIPTLVGYANGDEVLRRSGVQSNAQLQDLFTAVSTGRPVSTGLSNGTRLLRLSLGLALMIAGWLAGYWLLGLVVGGIISFTAVYDRCPIYRAVTARIKKLFHKENNLASIR
jgi:thioredoxin